MKSDKINFTVRPHVIKRKGNFIFYFSGKDKVSIFSTVMSKSYEDWLSRNGVKPEMAGVVSDVCQRVVGPVPQSIYAAVDADEDDSSSTDGPTAGVSDAGSVADEVVGADEVGADEVSADEVGADEGAFLDAHVGAILGADPAGPTVDWNLILPPPADAMVEQSSSRSYRRSSGARKRRRNPTLRANNRRFTKSQSQPELDL